MQCSNAKVTFCFGILNRSEADDVKANVYFLNNLASYVPND